MVDTHGNVCYLQKELPKTAGAARHKEKTPAEEYKILRKNLTTPLCAEGFFDIPVYTAVHSNL